MQKIIIAFTFILISLSAISQDKIYLTDNSVVMAKISEITVSEVKYKKFDNPTGPDYVLPKSMIAVIIYENGTHEVMNAVKNEELGGVEMIDILPYYKTGKNLVSLNYFDLIYKNISFTYNRFLCDYRFSIGMNASFGLTYNNAQYQYGSSFLNFDRDYFHGSLTANYFPSGMKKVSYFTGLSLMVGQGGEFVYDYYGPYILQDKSYYGFYVNNGIQFNLSKHFNMRTALALGMVDRDMNGDFQTHAMFELSAGIRF